MVLAAKSKQFIGGQLMNPRTIKKQVFSRLFNLTEHDLTA